MVKDVDKDVVVSKPKTNTLIEELIQQGYSPPVAAALAEIMEPIYGGITDYLDLQTALDVAPIKARTNSGTRKQQNTTKMSTGGYLENMLSEEMTVDELLNILR